VSPVSPQEKNPWGWGLVWRHAPMSSPDRLNRVEARAIFSSARPKWVNRRNIVYLPNATSGEVGDRSDRSARIDYPLPNQNPPVLIGGIRTKGKNHPKGVGKGGVFTLSPHLFVKGGWGLARQGPFLLPIESSPSVGPRSKNRAG
jgi:hypothetical protein